MPGLPAGCPTGIHRQAVGSVGGDNRGNRFRGPNPNNQPQGQFQQKSHPQPQNNSHWQQQSANAYNQNYGDPNDLIQFHDCPPGNYQNPGNQSQPNYQPQRNYQQQYPNYQVPQQHNYHSQDQGRRRNQVQVDHEQPYHGPNRPSQGPQTNWANRGYRNEPQFSSAPTVAPVAQGPSQNPQISGNCKLANEINPPSLQGLEIPDHTTTIRAHPHEYACELEELLGDLRQSTSLGEERDVMGHIRRVLKQLRAARDNHLDPRKKQPTTERGPDEVVSKSSDSAQATTSTPAVTAVPQQASTASQAGMPHSSTSIVTHLRFDGILPGVPYIKGIDTTSANPLPYVYTSFLFTHSILEELFPLARGRIYRACKWGDAWKVTVVLDPRQYGTNVRQLHISGTAPNIRSFQRDLTAKIQDLGLSLLHPDYVNPPISPQSSVHSWRHPSPNLVIEIERPVCGFLNNQDSVCLGHHFLRDHDGCYKCRREKVRHDGPKCPRYPIGTENEEHCYRFTQDPRQ
ncbi:unnamed protein product [Allacma fusca]|uniref:Uncharacterized protein n=1 Tax=Allacma fusca TaxID=39272 RepID=A0A8J2L3B9_9HEXA|nr:unnamed protein product [Allacma fusca]